MFSGVPKALIAVNAIDLLCQLFSSSNETTIGNAAIALGFLSYVPEGRRKLLRRYLVNHYLRITNKREKHFPLFFSSIEMPKRTGNNEVFKILQLFAESNTETFANFARRLESILHVEFT